MLSSNGSKEEDDDEDGSFLNKMSDNFEVGDDCIETIKSFTGEDFFDESNNPLVAAEDVVDLAGEMMFGWSRSG